MQWNDVIALAMQWPEVAESISYGEPSLKVRKRLLARHRVQDDSIVLLDVPIAEREHLIDIMPEAFFCERHYDGHEIVLARLAHAPADVVERILERRWRLCASRRALSDFGSPTSRSP